MTDYTELQKSASYAAQDTIKFADEDEEMRALQRFHEEVDTETILALIAESESARKHWQNESNNVQVLMAEVARLKADNDRLTAELDCPFRLARHSKRLVEELRAEVVGLNADNEALRNALTDCSDSLHGEMLQKFGGQLPDDMHPVTRREYDRDMGEVAGYRVALGKGEQS